MSQTDGDFPDSRGARSQFGLGTVLGMFFALALYLATLRRIDTAAVVYGCVILVAGLVMGGVSGLIAGRMADAAYWASLCGALGYVASAGEASFDTGFCLAWAAVGVVSGAGANVVSRRRPILSVFIAGVAAALVMNAYLAWHHGSLLTARFDAMCAPIVGVLVAILIQVLQFVEADRRLPRYTIASWLLGAVLAGNLVVGRFIIYR